MGAVDALGGRESDEGQAGTVLGSRIDPERFIAASTTRPTWDIQEKSILSALCCFVLRHILADLGSRTWAIKTNNAAPSLGIPPLAPEEDL